MSATPRLAMPFIAPGQAQKELFHNEALQLLDIVVAAAVEEPPRASPPPSPVVGSCYIVGTSPTGDWTAKAGQLASFTSGGWRYVPPVEGLTALVRSSGLCATYRAGAWDVGTLSASKLVIGGQQVVGARGSAIPAPAGGATIDVESRSAIGQILGALRSHGMIAI